MEELLDFGDSTLKNVITQKINSENFPEKVIKINGDLDDNFKKIPLQNIVPEKWTPKKIRVTKVQREMIVEETLGMKENNENPEILAIKNLYEKYNPTEFKTHQKNNNWPVILAIRNFYEKFHPTEFENHQKFNNWHTASLSIRYVRRWVQSHFQEPEKKKKNELEKIELEKDKTVEEIQREKTYKIELEEFLAKPKVIIDVTPLEKNQIIYRQGE